MSGQDSSVMMLMLLTSSSVSFCFGFSIERRFLLKNLSGYEGFEVSVAKLKAFTNEGTGMRNLFAGFFFILVVTFEIWGTMSDFSF